MNDGASNFGAITRSQPEVSANRPDRGPFR